MNRRDFFKLTGAGLLSMFAPHFGGTMLPSLQTNRYGDMLVEFYRGLKDGTLPEGRVEFIREEFNRLWDKLQKSEPRVYSPLHVFHCYRDADQTISNNTWTAITFERSAGDISAFNFYANDKSKLGAGIDASWSKYNVGMDGIISWTANTTGDRVVRIRDFNAAGTELGSQELSNGPTSNSGGFGLVQNFSWTEDIRGGVPNVAYWQLEVYQNSGSDLTVYNAVASLKVA